MQNLINYFLIVAMVVTFTLSASAQKVECYVHISDMELVPEEDAQLDNDVKFKSKNSKMDKLLKEYKPKKFKKAFPTAKTAWLREVYIVESSNKEFGKKLKEEFKKEIPLVEFLEEPTLIVDDYIPNDYHPNQTSLDLINAQGAYNYYRALPKIPVALTDTYFEAHEDLDYIGIWGSNSNTTSYHGTSVAGLISATTDNNIGIASVGYDTRIMASSNWGDPNEVLLLAQAGYRVINCSWGHCSFLASERAVYEEIRDVWDAIVVCGAGNRNCNQNGYGYFYPAAYDVNVSVTSITHGANPDWHEQTPGDVLTSYQHNDSVDICAPGYNVYTTDLMGSAGYSSGNYKPGWGTSYAAPQVAGALGMIFTINPCLSADEAEEILLNTVDPSLYDLTENKPYIGLLGEGRLDIESAASEAALSATFGLYYITLRSDYNFNANYAIHINNFVVLPGVDANFQARKEIIIDGPFEISTGSDCLINCDANLVINCN